MLLSRTEVYNLWLYCILHIKEAVLEVQKWVICPEMLGVWEHFQEIVTGIELFLEAFLTSDVSRMFLNQVSLKIFKAPNHTNKFPFSFSALTWSLLPYFYLLCPFLFPFPPTLFFLFVSFFPFFLKNIERKRGEDNSPQRLLLATAEAVVPEQE